MKKMCFFIAGLIIFSAISSFSQVRIAVFPFMNKDGNLKLNIWCYKFQDSLTKALYNRDPEEKYYRIVPYDSVEGILAQLNLDPNNPQYKSDMWKAADSISVMWVVTGILFLTAQGEPGKINTAKTSLFAAIGGTILIILANGAIAFVKNSFGI